ncbi:RagB/SusD family nutrient uptake outer membrane protein [Puteibacter caeruleilacunae]|nr:RagB/SusD family nutrient uptake outer membrane protein [Puteibacter caeruleilacunae]
MKKIFIILISFLGLIYTSCDTDILDKKPLDKYSELDVWTDAALAEGFVFDIYADVVKGLYVTQYTDDWTDNIVCNDDNGNRWTQAGSIENTADFGWNQYGRIRKCNLAIEKLGESTDIDENIRTQLIAEAKMLRAMTNFWMARRFGGIMIVDKVLTPDDDMKLPRATESATYDFIIADIDAAVSGLPETADKGRLTKGAAHAFMTMVALQAGKYDKVISAADAVESFGYDLEPEYKNLFNSFAGTTSSNEVILMYQVDKDHNNFIDTRMFRSLLNCYNGPKLKADAVPQYSPEDEFNAWPLRWPSQELVDAYLVIEDGAAVQKTWEDFQGLPSREMWKNRDARFEQSIVRDSAIYSKSTFTFRRGGNAHWTSNPLSTWGMSKSGYMFRKWMYENEYFFWNYPIDWAEPILRLGEVYLNKAEAYGRKGNLPKAIEYMNKTRVTHGGLPELSASATEADFWKYYKIERQVEMVQEDDRYWSLIRWARAENATSIPELNGYKLHGLDMNFDGITNVIESPFTVDMKFEMPKRLLFPVPDAQIRENDNLSQNPGWN